MRTMLKPAVILLLVASWAGTSSFLVLAADVPTSRLHGQHRITTKQIDAIRQQRGHVSARALQQSTVSTAAFSVPNSSRGKTVDSAEKLQDYMSRMPRHQRYRFFGVNKAQVSASDAADVVANSQDVIFHEMDVTETDHEAPLIDVDGDGVLDQVDAIRYSGPDFPNRRLCGPTLVFRRNQKLVLHLRNWLKAAREPVLEWNQGFEPPEPPDPPAYWIMDAPHELFTTNIHMHGLHISPGGGHDNSFLESVPTSSDTPTEMFLDYELQPDHIAGTFWYHGHRHGSVAYQLANGMAGALIVEGDPSPDSPDLESLPEIQAANQIKHPTDTDHDSDYGRVMLFQQLVFTKTTLPATDANGVTRDRWIVDPADVNDRKCAPNEKNIGRITEGIPPAKPESAEVLAVNGQNAPSIDIQRGQIERWRMIHAGRESALNLAWYNAADLKDGTGEAPDMSDAIEMYEIATDGIPTGRITKQTNVELYPGYRSDVLLRVTDKAVDGEYWLLPSEATRLTRTHLGPVKNAAPAAKLLVSGELAAPMQLPTPAKMARFRRPPPDVTNADTVDLHFTFADKERFGVSTVGHGSGKPYAESGGAESLVMKLDTPQVWNLSVREFLPGVAESIKHPFHIHVNPFYIPSMGVWKDTIVISREEVTKIAFIPTDYCGRSILHCHILDHEDQGMMKDIQIDGTSRAQYPELYQLERLPEREWTQYPDLQLDPNKNNVFVFVNGMGCAHCAQGVIQLWKRADPLKFMNASIKCMSAAPIDRSTLATFGLKPKEFFTFQQVPRTFDLSQTATTNTAVTLIPTSAVSTADPATPATTHGVLIFDTFGRLRYRYLGDRPISDLDEITYALMELREAGSNSKGWFQRTTRAK